MKILTKTALLLALIMPAIAASAQNTTSPYSMYGYGIINDRATSTQRQMGGIGYAMNSGRQINIMNPASYAAIDSLTFLWDMGVDVSMLWTQEGSAKEHSVGGGLDYLSMQFPISKHIGASIGLLPYTSVGYSFGNKVAHGTLENQGSGGINEAYVGVSATYFGISIGANISYDFGNIINDIYSSPTTSGKSLFEHVMRIRDWNITLGAQYSKRWNRFNKATVGVTFNPKKSLHGSSMATVQDLVYDSRPDTVGNLRLGGNYYQPNTIGVGFNFTRERTSRIMAEVDFTYQDWANAKFSPMYDKNGKLLFDGMKFNNRYKVAAGGEYVPRVRGTYGQRIAFRFGGYYSRDYLNIRSNQVKEYGLSCGLGLPTPEGKTVINFGFEWKKRFATPVNLISENYFNVMVGVNFNELWFWQRKIK